MKTKIALLLSLMLTLGQAYAATKVYTHPHAKDKPEATKMMAPGYCQIEIINQRSTMLAVYGTFDDNSTLSFYVNPGDIAYINLYYYGACHNDMYLTINSPYATLFSGYIPVYTTLRP